jgi:hypothetical protein
MTASNVVCSIVCALVAASRKDMCTTWSAMMHRELLVHTGRAVRAGLVVPSSSSSETGLV